MKKQNLWIAVVLIAAVPATVTLAHEGATGVVKERMDLMVAMNKEMKSIHQKIATNRNLAGIADSAAKIKEMSGNIAGKFPAGSLTPPTDAKPIIWEQWNQFEAHIGTLQVSLDALAAAAPSGDPKLISNKFNATAHSCNACHDDFRKKSH